MYGFKILYIYNFHNWCSVARPKHLESVLNSHPLKVLKETSPSWQYFILFFSDDITIFTIQYLRILKILYVIWFSMLYAIHRKRFKSDISKRVSLSEKKMNINDWNGIKTKIKTFNGIKSFLINLYMIQK